MASPNTPMDPISSDQKGRADFGSWPYTAELEYIRAWRAQDDKNEADLTGLSLSGGGIRAGVFSRGVLQALAQRDQLKNIDYISAASGGGYTVTALPASEDIAGLATYWKQYYNTPQGKGTEAEFIKNCERSVVQAGDAPGA